MKKKIIKLILFSIFIGLLITLCVPRSYALASSPYPKEVDMIKVEIYLLKSDEYCLDVEFVPVERIVKNDAVEKLIRTVLKKLFEGPKKEERERPGLWTAIPDGVKVNSVEVNDGVAHIDLSKELQKYGGGSLSALCIERQIRDTIEKFPSIKEVVITVEGKGEKDGILQP